LDIIQEIIADIGKTGFVLELRVGQSLRTRGYHVGTNLYFVDRDEEKGREVDIRALKNLFFETDNVKRAVRHCLLIECKKSVKRPWIFFTSPTGSYDQTLREVPSSGASDGWIGATGATVREGHPWFRIRERGRSFYEAFSNEAEASPSIHKAVLGCVKALIETHEKDFAAGYSHMSNAIFYYPMVVLEGELFTAHLSDSDLIVTPVDQVLVSVHYRSSHYPRDDRHSVMVVRESAFPKVVDELDVWLQTCADRFEADSRLFLSVATKPDVKALDGRGNPSQRKRKKHNKWADSRETANR
jgi:hypothetical protein